MKCVEPDGSDPDDADLLRRVKRGDRDAFAPVVRRHLPSLRAFVALHLAAPQWGRTEEWVRVTLFRVRRQLRACIESKLAGGHHAT